MGAMFIIRGLPGSGKSTLGRYMTEHSISADDYFIDPNGNYNFNASLLKAAHESCRERARIHMQQGDTFSVCNTFTQEWEMQPYFDLAKQYGYTVYVIVVENRHGGKNIHYVPEATIEKMRNRFEIKL